MPGSEGGPPEPRHRRTPQSGSRPRSGQPRGVRADVVRAGGVRGGVRLRRVEGEQAPDAAHLGVGKPMDAEAAAKAKAERAEVIAKNAEWRSSETVRRPWLAEFAQRKTAPKDAAAFHRERARTCVADDADARPEGAQARGRSLERGDCRPSRHRRSCRPACPQPRPDRGRAEPDRVGRVGDRDVQMTRPDRIHAAARRHRVPATPRSRLLRPSAPARWCTHRSRCPRSRRHRVTPAASRATGVRHRLEGADPLAATVR